MAEKERLPYVYARRHLQALERVLEDGSRELSESSQIIVWLVGLASAVIVVAVGDIARVKELMPTGYNFVLCFLMATVFLGVACRMLDFWITRESTRLHSGLYGFWTGFLAAANVESPLSPVDQKVMIQLYKILAAHLGLKPTELKAGYASDETLEEIRQRVIRRRMWERRNEILFWASAGSYALAIVALAVGYM